MDLRGKTILVTGSTSGLGKQIVLDCSRTGASCVCIGRNDAKLKALEKELGVKKEHHFLNIDLLLEESKLLGTLKAFLKQNNITEIHGFVHAAGIEITKPLSVLTEKDYFAVLKVNLISALEILKVITKKRHISDNGSSYVFISSILAQRGAAAQLPYSASKGALNAIVKSLAIELKNKNCRVNAISPGQIADTEMTSRIKENLTEEKWSARIDKHFLGLPKAKDISNGVLFLLSNRAGMMTGTNVTIDGGYCAY